MAQVLVVDDSSTVRDEVATFLRKGGLDVAIAVDGKDGLAKLQADPKNQARGGRRQYAEHGWSHHGREDPQRAA
jgi:CheY-like chemotaxis protein